MTAVAVEITSRPAPIAAGPAPEPTGVLFVEDIEELTAGSAPGCNDDNPYV
ncbi:hypothetical protein ACFWAT_14360 [Streptomyces syringium]|uniref:hypothetical protein n=1 Tax=Streptomyces syringium TaxID=76729 RepID=UPI0036511947